MADYAPASSTSDTIQASNNNAGESGAIYLNFTKSKLGGMATGGKGGEGGTGKGGGANAVSGQLNLNQTDHGSVDKAFALAELAMMESFNESRSLRTADRMALETMSDQVTLAKQSDGGEGERLTKMALALVGVAVVVYAIFGSKK